MRNDLEELRALYRQKTTEELLRIAHIDYQDYTPEAIQVVEEELQRRGVSAENDPHIQTLLADLKEEATQQEQRQNSPLGFGLKVVCFIFCAPGIIIALYQQSKYGRRRAREVWKWVGYGWLFHIILAAGGITKDTLWKRYNDAGSTVIPYNQTKNDSPANSQNLPTATALADAIAQFDLGVAYFKDKNYSKAAKMWKIATNAGILEAYNNLGYLTYYGMGVKEDHMEGFGLWRIAAENGYSESQRLMAEAYSYGIYPKKDSLNLSEFVVG
jgi:TPR repeat protein